jgi:glycosyltransferase involved in cell wall biosynthesis
MERPTLSVIIPVYNGSKFIGDTISSILAQPCKDFELILLDDGSTDNSLDVCKSFNSENVRVLSQANMGVSKTRNRGIEEAKGDIIIFSDQDDSMKRNFYTEDMRQKLLTAYNEGIDMIIPGRWVGDNDLSKGKFVSIEKYKSGIYQGHSDSLSWEFYNVFNANIYFRRLFYNQCDEKAPVRFLDLPLDVETTFRHMAQYASDKILLSDEYSFSVRRANISSVSSTWDWLKVYPVRCDAYYQLIDWHKNKLPSR